MLSYKQAGQYYNIKVGSQTFYSAAEFMYWRKTLTDDRIFAKTCRREQNPWNSWFSVHSLLSPVCHLET